MYLFVLKHWC